MTQQINLFSPGDAPKEQRFTARSLAQALVAVVVVGGALSGLLVWKLHRSTADYQQTLAAQERDIQGLNAVLAASHAGAASVDANLQKQLQAARARLQQREALLTQLRDGAPEPGKGPADQLLLLSRTIPDRVWVTAMTADGAHMDISGYTLEPSAINEWVGRLSRSTVLEGTELSAVHVENISGTPQAAALAQSASTRTVWSYQLVSTRLAVPAPPGGNP